MSHLIRPVAAAAAALLAVTALAGCDDGAKDGAASPSASAPADSGSAVLPASLTGQKPRWTTCSAPTVAQGGGEAPGSGWECATLKVPLDYAAPAGGTIDLAMIRKKAKDRGKRLGSLVYNFGGPGASGVATLPFAAEDYGKLNSRYDLVSFDPRGVGESAGVICLDDKAMDADTQEAGPVQDGVTEAREALKEGKEYAAACVKNSAKVLPHVGTTNAAHDLDLMRQVLGDRKLNYFGISYGTELGGVYAHLYPKNVGRTVLDAVVDPTQGRVEQGLAQAKGFQAALENAMEYCVEQYAQSCPTGPNAEEGNRRIGAVLEKLEKKPAPTEDPDGRRLTAGLAATGIAAALYNEEGWELLVQGIGEVQQNGTGNNLLMAADGYLGRDAQGRFSNMAAANTAISCADSKERFTPEQAAARITEFKKVSPVFGEGMAIGLVGCADWPVEGERVTPEVGAAGAGPIVVIGNAGDPATPVAGARRMAERLGAGVGVHLTVQGEGHGTYGVNSCATRAVDGYLLEGRVPTHNTVCE
ncbi:alpha/beta hydrolase [Streptomyces sp. SP18CS02]|uniref:alpha/beta hydrolase n=1 Tax=Streptomyces sp. SP18CS02 TaxID=3002531 RepID=UPI002E7827FE|nr:alpha/beta hydrolase [Streptomyces sp. SP18CS02]MEE1751565.1 alpha/beta hydrolase [Streptomyces sp. SP18CS02]